MKKSISEYAEELEGLTDAGAIDAIVKLRVHLSVNLVSLWNTEYKPVRVVKDRFWKLKDFEAEIDGETGEITVLKMREKLLSDTAVEHLWGLTDTGQKETKLDITIKSYKVLIDSATSVITWAQTASKLDR